MGIKNLNTLVNDLSPGSITFVPLSKWKGKRVGIDMNNLMYIHMAVAWKEVVNESNIPFDEPNMENYQKKSLNSIKGMITTFLKYQVAPVIVFDGPPSPEKEIMARTMRREKKADSRKQYEELFSVLKEQDPLTVGTEDINTLKKYLRALVPVTTTDIEMVKSILSGIGIPIFQSTGEAEALCSLMCRTGRVDFVYSTDTDNLTYGCPNLMTGFEGKVYDPESERAIDQVKMYDFYALLSDLGITHKQFIDVCIMSGCDYNTNIRNIGVKKSYKLIQEWGSIDNLPDIYDVTCLNHHRCRELFSEKKYNDLCENHEDNVLVNTDSLSLYARELLEPYGMDYWISELVEIYRDFQQKPFRPLIYPSDTLVDIEIVIDDDNNSDHEIIILD